MYRFVANLIKTAVQKRIILVAVLAVFGYGVSVAPVFAQVSISGTLYQNNGTTAITTAKTIAAAIATSTPSRHTTTSDGSGNFTFASLATSTIGSWSTSTATSRTWQSIAYGGGRFVAVACGSATTCNTTVANRVMISDNGTSWTDINSVLGDNDSWRGITYGNGLFVAVGSAGDRVMTSLDGLTWTARSAANNDDFWTDITYGNGLFVAVASNGDRAMYSSDGVNWTVSATPPVSRAWQAVTYSNGLFVAVGCGGTSSCSVTATQRIATSPDGNIWTMRDGGGNNDYWNDVTFGGGQFVAVSNTGDTIATSPDGTTWTVQTPPVTRGLIAVTYANGLYAAMACGSATTCDTTSATRLLTSRDAVTWTDVSMATDNDTWADIVFGNGLLIALGLNGDRVATAFAGFGDSTPVTIFVDGDTTKATTLFGIASTSGTITGADLYADTVRAQHVETNGVINLVPGDFYNNSDDSDINFYSTLSSTTIGTKSSPTDFVTASTTRVNAPKFLFAHDDIDSGGGFTGGQVRLIGESVQTATGTGAYFNLAILNTAGSGEGTQSVVFTTPLTVSNKFSMAASTSAEFLAGATTTTKFIDLFGDPVSPVWLRSSTGGTKWGLNVTSTTTPVIYGIDIEDVRASSSLIVFHSTDAGNNTNFTFSTNTQSFKGTVYLPDGVTPDLGERTIGFGYGTSTKEFSVKANLDGEYSFGTGAQTWDIGTFATTTNSLLDIAHGNGTFVAVGSSGDRVVYSTDGITWATTSAAGNDDSWYGITHGNGTFVAVGGAGDRVMYSNDGITWSTTTAAGNDDNWFSVAYGNGTFVAVGALSGDRVMYSSDGITWSTTTAAGDNDSWYGVTYADNKFVAVSCGGTSCGTAGDRVMYSSDGITWSTTTAAGNDDIWFGVTYGAGKFVAVSCGGTSCGTAGDRVMYSTDGITWSTTTAAGNDDAWKAVTYGNDLFVALSDNGDRVMYSTDGITWSTTSAAGDNDSWRSIVYEEGKFVGVAFSGDTIMYSLGNIDKSVPNTMYLDDARSQGATVGFASTSGRFDVYQGQLRLKKTNEGDEIDFNQDVFFDSSNDTNIPLTVNSGSSSVGTIDVQMDLRITEGASFVAPSELYLYGDLVQEGSFDNNTGTVYFSGPDPVVEGDLAGGNVLNDVVVNPSGATATNWETRSVPTTGNWTNITYGGGMFVAVCSFCSDSIMYSSDGITWATSTTEVSGGDSWQSVTYGNGKFVAVADGTYGTNRVMYSTDGITWATTSAAANNDSWKDIVFGNGMFLAVSNSGDRVMYSTDGITWATSSAAGNNDQWSGVTYGEGLFVAVGSATDRVMTSPDGITWTIRSAAGNNDQWEDVTYGNGIFVAVGYTGGDQVMTSLDGIVWTVRSLSGDNGDLVSLAFGNDMFVAGSVSGTYRIRYSTDGITWTTVSAAGDNEQWYGIAYGKGTFVSVSTGSDYVISSTGFLTLPELSVNDIIINPDKALIATTTLTVIGDFTNSGTIQNTGTIIMSGVGATLTAQGTTSADATLGNLEVSGSVTLADVPYISNLTIGGGGSLTGSTSVYLSGDLTQSGSIDFSTTTLYLQASQTLQGNFTGSNQIKTTIISSDRVDETTSIAAAGDDTWTSVTYGNGVYVAVADGFYGTDRVMYSSDGITWATTSAAGDDDTWQDIAYGNGKFVAIGDIGFGGEDFVMYSSDGITWATTSAAGDNDGWRGVTYGNDKFVAVGYTGDRVMYSSDGITWATTTAAGNNDSWYGVTYGNGLFVAVGNIGGTDRVMYSNDGITWATTSAAGNDDRWSAVTYGNDKFVAVGATGATDRVMYSNDGITWATTSAAGDNDSWNGVTYDSGAFVAVGGGAEGVITSPDGVTWKTRSVAGNDDSWRGVTYGNDKFVAVGYIGDRAVTIKPANVLLSSNLQTDSLTIDHFHTLNASSSTLTLGGNYTNNNGVFNADSSTVVFAGTSQQTATGTLSSTSSFYNLSITNTSGNGTTSRSVKFGAPLSVSNTFTMAASTSAEFLAGATSTIQNINLQGTTNSPVWLRSTATSSTWYLDVPGNQLNVDYVNVQDSTASSTINALDSFDNGNNVNWTFGTGTTSTSTGSTTLANHTASQVSNAFNFQNKTDEALFAFRLTPNSGTATVTNMVFALTGIENVLSSNFTNIRLLRDYDSDATYDATDGAVGGTGVMSIINDQGTITFTGDFLATTTQNYILVADWNAPANGSFMRLVLPQSGLIMVDTNGAQEIFGSVTAVQHNRNNKSGGGGAAADIGGAPPQGNTPQTGGGGGGGNDIGEQIDSNGNYNRPTGSSGGTWTNPEFAYDATDGTRAINSFVNGDQSRDYQDFGYGIPSGSEILGIEVQMEASRGGIGVSVSIDTSLSWNNGSNYTSTKSTGLLTTTDVVYTLGGPTDTWGRTWTAEEFNNGSFLTRIFGDLGANGQARVDEMQVRVYFETVTTGGGSGGGGDI